MAAVIEQVQQVLGAGGCPDGGDDAGLGDVFGGGKDRGAAEGVVDQDRGGRVVVAQVVRRVDQVGDVRSDVGVGEFAVGPAETGEVEAEHRDAVPSQRLRDPRRGKHVLAAREAVRKEREGLRLGIRHVQPPRQRGAA